MELEENIKKIIESLQDEMIHIRYELKELESLIKMYDESDEIGKKKIYDGKLSEKMKTYREAEKEKLLKRVEELKLKIIAIVNEKYKNVSTDIILNRYSKEFERFESTIGEIEVKRELLKPKVAVIEQDYEARAKGEQLLKESEEKKRLEEEEKVRRDFKEILDNPESSELGFIKSESYRYNYDIEMLPTVVGTKGEVLLYEKFGILRKTIPDGDKIYFDKEPDSGDDFFKLQDELKLKQTEKEITDTVLEQDPEKYEEMGIIEIKGVRIEVSQKQLLKAGLDPEFLGWKSKEISSTDIARGTKGEVIESVLKRMGTFIKNKIKIRNNRGEDR